MINLIHPATVLGHAAETDGGPTGFGWASFVTFAVGAVVVSYSAGQLAKVLHMRRTRRHDSHTDTTADSSHRHSLDSPSAP